MSHYIHIQDVRENKGVMILRSVQLSVVTLQGEGGLYRGRGGGGSTRFKLPSHSMQMKVYKLKQWPTLQLNVNIWRVTIKYIYRHWSRVI